MATLGLQDRGGVCDLRVVESVGCEKFAELCYQEMAKILNCFQTDQPYRLMRHDRIDAFEPRYTTGQKVRLRSAEVFEHDGNSAVYEG
jgi:hypothetical protein